MALMRWEKPIYLSRANLRAIDIVEMAEANLRCLWIHMKFVTGYLQF